MRGTGFNATADVGLYAFFIRSHGYLNYFGVIGTIGVFILFKLVSIRIFNDYIML